MKQLLMLALVIGAGCASTPEPTPTTAPVTPPPAAKPQSFASVGIHSAVSTDNFESTYALVRSTVVTRPNTVIVAEIDHQKNASSNGIELEPTRVILFDNPSHTTPLMKLNPVVGLDRPQRIIVFERNTITYVATDLSDYVSERHAVKDPVLAKSDLKLSVIGIDTKSPQTPTMNEGVVTVASAKSVDDTYATLKKTILQNEKLNVMAEYDFADAARRSGESLAPAKLIVFGNPALGTPLMNASPTMPLDLPQKILVYTATDGSTAIAYNDPSYLTARHGVTNDPIVQKIAGALKGLTAKAAE